MCNRCGNPHCFGGRCEGFPFIPRGINRPNWNPPYTQPGVNGYGIPFNRNCIPPVPPSLIPQPCGCGPCQQNGCLTLILSDCVVVPCPLPCTGTPPNATLTSVLQALDAEICALQTSGTPTPAPSGTCGTWTVFRASDNTTTPEGIINEIRIDGCGDVTFRGDLCQTFTLAAANNTLLSIGDSNVTSGSGPFYVLPAGNRPPQIVALPIVVTVTAGGPILGTTGRILIDTSGNMFFNLENAVNQFPATVAVQVCFSLDNIRFSIAPL